MKKTIIIDINHYRVYVPVSWTRKGLGISIPDEDLVSDIEFNNEFLEEYGEEILEEVTDNAENYFG